MNAPAKPREKPVDINEYVRAVVDQAPPLTAAQRARLAVLLTRRPSRGESNAA